MAHLLWIMKRNLSRGHARVLEQIRPGCIDDGHIIFLITFVDRSSAMITTQSPS